MAARKAWQDVLSALGVLIEPVTPMDVRLTFEDESRTARLLVLDYVLTPSRAEQLPNGLGLVVVPRASPTAMAEAAERQWAVVTPSGNVDLRGLGLDVVATAEQRVMQARHETVRLAKGPIPWGSLFAVRRLLAATIPVTQLDLARLIGASQPQVHRALKPLLEEGLVERHRDGFAVADLQASIDWWLSRYPGPRGIRSYWTSLDSPTEQAARLMADAKELANASVDQPNVMTGRRIALSGDAAVDLIAPWRRPSQAVVYAERPFPPRSSGLVQAASAETATLVLISPQDPGVWLPCRWPGVDQPVADPLQVLYDLEISPGADAQEAAANWRDALVNRLRGDWSVAAGYDH